MKKIKDNKGKKWIFIAVILTFIANVIGAVFSIFFIKNRKKLRKYATEQKREINELITGKETLKKFYKDSSKLFKNCFIPSESNDHRPYSLRPKALATYLIIAVLIKLFSVSFLFLTYPSPAKLAYIISSEMIALTNQDRIKNNLPPLNISPELSQAALAKGNDMLDRKYFSHDTPEGKKPWGWIDKSQYDYVYAGENLAMDFTNGEMIQRAFMKSPSHRKNILNPKYEDIGVAVVSGDMNGRQSDILVVFFGAKRTLVAKSEPIEQSAAVVSPVAATTPAIAEPTRPSVAEEINDSIIQETDLSETRPASEELIAGLETGNLAETNSENIMVIGSERSKTSALVEVVIFYANLILTAFIIFLIISLLLNIFIKINVQNHHVILQSVVVIALLLSMLFAKFHFIERIDSNLIIL